MNVAFYSCQLEFEGPVKSSRNETKKFGLLHGPRPWVLCVCVCSSPIGRNLLELLCCEWVAGEVSWLTCQSTGVVRSRVSRQGSSPTVGET